MSLLRFQIASIQNKLARNPDVDPFRDNLRSQSQTIPSSSHKGLQTEINTLNKDFHPDQSTTSKNIWDLSRSYATICIRGSDGSVPEWLMGVDCKSTGYHLRWFESNPAHHN